MHHNKLARLALAWGSVIDTVAGGGGDDGSEGREKEENNRH